MNEICGHFWSTKVASGHLYLAMFTICSHLGVQLARKSGQLAIFENKSGQ